MNSSFLRERGSVASEFSSGLMLVAILAIGVLWVMAQLEGVSFAVLLSQLRHGTQH